MSENFRRTSSVYWGGLNAINPRAPHPHSSECPVDDEWDCVHGLRNFSPPHSFSGRLMFRKIRWVCAWCTPLSPDRLLASVRSYFSVDVLLLTLIASRIEHNPELTVFTLNLIETSNFSEQNYFNHPLFLISIKEDIKYCVRFLFSDHVPSTNTTQMISFCARSLKVFS